MAGLTQVSCRDFEYKRETLGQPFQYGGIGIHGHEIPCPSVTFSPMMPTAFADRVSHNEKFIATLRVYTGWSPAESAKLPKQAPKAKKWLHSSERTHDIAPMTSHNVHTLWTSFAWHSANTAQCQHASIHAEGSSPTQEQDFPSGSPGQHWDATTFHTRLPPWVGKGTMMDSLTSTSQL